LAIALAVAGGFFGSLYGLCAGPSGEEIERGMASLRAAAEKTRFAARVGDRVRADGRVAPRWVALESADTILELGPPLAALVGPWKADPPLELVVALPARLLRASDGAVLWSATFPFRGPQAPFGGWTSGEGRGLSEALERAAAPIADRVVEEAFLLYLLPRDRKLREDPR
jgi:hypothetical protein